MHCTRLRDCCLEMASSFAPQMHRHGHYDRILRSACSPYWRTDIAGELVNVYLVSGYATASAAALVSSQVTGCGLRIWNTAALFPPPLYIA